MTGRDSETVVQAIATVLELTPVSAFFKRASIVSVTTGEQGTAIDRF
jgi:hypothetical protein